MITQNDLFEKRGKTSNFNKRIVRKKQQQLETIEQSKNLPSNVEKEEQTLQNTIEISKQMAKQIELTQSTLSYKKSSVSNNHIKQRFASEDQKNSPDNQFTFLKKFNKITINSSKKRKSNNWSNKINRKEQQIILSYLNGKLSSKPKKKKSLQKQFSSQLYNKQLQIFTSEAKHSAVNTSLLSQLDILSPTSVQTRKLQKLKKSFINTSRHASILVKQHQTLQKQRKIIEKLQDKVEQVERGKTEIGKMKGRSIETFEMKRRESGMHRRNMTEQNQSYFNQPRLFSQRSQFSTIAFDDSFSQRRIYQSGWKKKYLNPITQGKFERGGFKEYKGNIGQIQGEYEKGKRMNEKITVPGVEFARLMTYYWLMAHKSEPKSLLKAGSIESIEGTLKDLPLQDEVHRFIEQYETINTSIDLKTIVKQDNFKVVYIENEKLIFGQFVDDKMEGFGVQIGKGYLFEGIFKCNERLSGIQLTDFGLYNGEFINGRKQGQGSFKWPNGQSYNGGWLCGRKHGSGIWSSTSGDHYIGQWVSGRVSGQGIHTSNGGQKYQGEFHGFLKHGWGKELLPNGDSYEGNFALGKPHGQGTYRWSTGQVYSGIFLQGSRTGSGTLLDGHGTTLKSQFSDQTPSGPCIIQYNTGALYTGTIQQYQCNGQGQYIKDEQEWFGRWRKGQFIPRKD